jgi:hypothetical protein
MPMPKKVRSHSQTRDASPKMHAIPCLFLFCFPLLDALLHEEVSHSKTKTNNHDVDGTVFVLGLHCLGATGGGLSGFACSRRGAGSGL